MKELSMTHICMIILSIIVIIMFFQIQKLSKNNNYEDITNTSITDAQLTSINNKISQIYNMDVEAIRNLGAISKSLLTGTNYHSTTVGTPGTLTIPADTTQFKGTVNIDNNLTVNGEDTTLHGGLTLNNINWDQSKMDPSVGHIVSDNNSFKALMIVGNNSAEGAKEVKVLDNMTVTNNLNVSGSITNTRLQTNGAGSITGQLDAGSVVTPRVNASTVRTGNLESIHGISYQPFRGNWGDNATEDRCPAGQVVRGIRIGYGGGIDGIGILCA
jgi:hypothetical protein